MGSSTELLGIASMCYENNATSKAMVILNWILNQYLHASPERCAMSFSANHANNKYFMNGLAPR